MLDTIVCNVMVDGSGWLSGFFHAVWTTVMENLTKLSVGILHIINCQTNVGKNIILCFEYEAALWLLTRTCDYHIMEKSTVWQKQYSLLERPRASFLQAYSDKTSHIRLFHVDICCCVHNDVCDPSDLGEASPTNTVNTIRNGNCCMAITILYKKNSDC